MHTERIKPERAARAIFAERYDGARVIFLAGSVVRGEATPASDLDLVVVYERLPHAYREAFFHAGWPVETFVHDPETLRYHFESDRRRGIPSLMRMVTEGIEIPGASEFSAGVKRSAAELLEAGPPRWDAAELMRRRYRLSDWVDDIRYPRTPEELVASGTFLYADLADFFLLSQNLGTAHSKTIPRRLREVDAGFAERFGNAFEALFVEKQPAPVITLVEEVLEQFGGILFEGFRRNSAPAERALSEAPPADA
ncbi:MAG TPA: nucleotidyltransferase domain-containing protein [Pyrinomonadaceae bacterium]